MEEMDVVEGPRRRPSAWGWAGRRVGPAAWQSGTLIGVAILRFATGVGRVNARSTVSVFPPALLRRAVG